MWQGIREDLIREPSVETLKAPATVVIVEISVQLVPDLSETNICFQIHLLVFDTLVQRLEE